MFGRKDRQENLATKSHQELIDLLGKINSMERGAVSEVVTECLVRLMEHFQPERLKRVDAER